ncbi:unnamed protein product [Brassica oleracea var. botrytis]
MFCSKEYWSRVGYVCNSKNSNWAFSDSPKRWTTRADPISFKAHHIVYIDLLWLLVLSYYVCSKS